MEQSSITKWNFYYNYIGDTSHSPNSVFILFLSDFLYLFFVCLLSHGSYYPNFPLSPPVLSSQVANDTNFSSSWWLPEVKKQNPEHTVFLGNMMPELLEERWKVSQSDYLMSYKKKNCLEFITTFNNWLWPHSEAECALKQ